MNSQNYTTVSKLMKRCSNTNTYMYYRYTNKFIDLHTRLSKVKKMSGYREKGISV